MAKHPCTDDFSDLLHSLVHGDIDEQADALCIMGFHADDKGIPPESDLYWAMASMMDLFQPVVPEEVEDGDYYLSGPSDDLMFQKGEIRDFLEYQVNGGLALIAQHIWGIDIKSDPKEHFGDFARRLQVEFESQVLNTQITDAVSQSIGIASRTTTKRM